MKRMKKFVLILTASMMTISLAGCGSSPTKSPQPQTEEAKQGTLFPEFQGTDFDGNSIDQSVFGKNEVTLLNFWSNGCTACVNEMPALEELNKKLREKGAEIIGVNVEASGGNESLEEAKKILAKQDVTYRNIFISGGKEAEDYLKNIFAFPTTVLVDKNGKIIGEPIAGNLEDEERIHAIFQMIDEVKAGKDVTTVLPSETEPQDEVTALIEEENQIFSEHQDVWDKVFRSMPKDNMEQMNDSSYAEFLKNHIETIRDSFTEDEQKILDKDIKRIEEIEKQIEELSED